MIIMTKSMMKANISLAMVKEDEKIFFGQMLGCWVSDYSAEW